MEVCYENLIIERICLNCGENVKSKVYEDDLGTFCSCPLCEASFDIDLTEEEKNFMEGK